MQEELKKILVDYFYVNDHENCDDSCSKKISADDQVAEAQSQITELFLSVIGEDEDDEDKWVDITGKNRLRADLRRKIME